MAPAPGALGHGATEPGGAARDLIPADGRQLGAGLGESGLKPDPFCGEPLYLLMEMVEGPSPRESALYQMQRGLALDVVSHHAPSSLQISA